MVEKNARHADELKAMFSTEQVLNLEPSQLLGDWHPLVAQLGSTEGLSEFSAIAGRLRLQAVDTPHLLEEFLFRYQEELLFPVELPAVQRAFEHASRNELREFIAFGLDQDLNRELRDFASASRRVGHAQAVRLKPLRDCRFVQRYLRAMEAGEADTWHTLVYGMTLSLYSLPLRQGLVHYGAETLRGFAQIACRHMTVSERRYQSMLRRRFDDLLGQVDSMIGCEPAKVLRIF